MISSIDAFKVREVTVAPINLLSVKGDDKTYTRYLRITFLDGSQTCVTLFSESKKYLKFNISEEV